MPKKEISSARKLLGIRVVPIPKKKIGDSWIRQAPSEVAEKAAIMYGSAAEAVKNVKSWLRRIEYKEKLDAWQDGHFFYGPEYIEFTQEVIKCLKGTIRNQGA